MKKLLSLFLVALFFALAAPAFAGEGNYAIGADEFTAPILDESSEATIQEKGDSYRRYRCPRGYSRVPSYRWNYRRHRWEFAGYACRRDGRRGRDDRRGPGDNSRGRY